MSSTASSFQSNGQLQKRASKAVIMPDMSSQYSSNSKRMSQMIVH